MKIGVVQTDSIAGDISKNIQIHLSFIKQAANLKADVLVFPELSVTGYEPSLASKLATFPDDTQFNLLREAAEQYKMTICIGMPSPTDKDPRISMGIFQPQKKPFIYSKRYLDPDEIPYFTNGEDKEILNIQDTLIAPAICYESLQIKHIKEAIELDAKVYMASVAIPQRSIQKAHEHYTHIAKKYNVFVVLSNCIGHHDNFIGAGRSAIWNTKGEQVAALDESEEGILVHTV